MTVNDQTLTLEESYAKAQESTLKEEPTEEEATDVVEQKEAQVATPEEPKTEEATDFEKIDPKTLSPELQKVYKDLHKGFTQGRQKDSEARHAAEEERDRIKAELEQLRKGSPNLTSDTPKFKTQEEYLAYVAKQAYQQEKVSDYRSQALVDYEATDERLRRPSEGKDNPSYDGWMDDSVSGKLDLLLAEHVARNGSELGFDHKSETKRLIEEWDRDQERRIKSYIDKQNQLVKGKAGESRVHNPKTSPGKAEPAKKMTFQEAMEAAQEKLKS